jgi:hypothetical protein
MRSCWHPNYKHLHIAPNTNKNEQQSMLGGVMQAKL